ncbi:hypothetical protein OAA60_03405 [Porticoccaceae bacterium]|nr:hypothetical protein [Porticoccaceae bacterium]
MPTYLETVNRHEVYLSRQATGILKDEVYPSINSAYRAVRLALLEYGDISSIQDVNRVNKIINQVISEELSQGFGVATQSMSTMAVNESVYSTALLSSSTTVLSATGESKVNKYVREAIMSLSSGKKKTAGVWSQYVKGYEDNFSRQYNSIITSAYSESLSSGKMQTVGQLTKQFRDLNNNVLRHDAETLVRTGVNHYTSKANQLMAADNSDIIEREVPIVTFDSRTSDVCISISSKYPKGWPQGESPIGYPPYHYGCRTIIGYLLYGQDNFEGTKASKGSEGGEQIKASTPFAKWLRTQPKSFVYETLGKRKGELFLQGKLPLANLTDKYLKPLPLSVLDV